MQSSEEEKKNKGCQHMQSLLLFFSVYPNSYSLLLPQSAAIQRGVETNITILCQMVPDCLPGQAMNPAGMQGRGFANNLHGFATFKCLLLPSKKSKKCLKAVAKTDKSACKVFENHPCVKTNRLLTRAVNPCSDTEQAPLLDFRCFRTVGLGLCQFLNSGINCALRIR